MGEKNVCSQGTEKLPNCKKSSLVYENVCLQCNPGADTRKELREVRSDTPTLYVGESSRIVFERSREHWSAWRSKKEDSHILKHQMAEHGGSSSPKFVMRVVRHYRSALSRQVGEAVRISRRGGARSILNSKSEYNRCRIPRLVMKEIDEEQIAEQEARELEEASEQLEACRRAWEQQRTVAREQELRTARSRLDKIETKMKSKKREQEQPEGGVSKRRKKLKYSVEEPGWGLEESSSNNGAMIVLDAPQTPTAGRDAPHTPIVGSSLEGSSLTPGGSSNGGSKQKLLQASIKKYAEPKLPEPADSDKMIPPGPGYEVGGSSFDDNAREQEEEPERLDIVGDDTWEQEQSTRDQEDEVLGAMRLSRK